MSLPFVAGVAASAAGPPSGPSGVAQHSDRPTPGSILAAEVGEIASAPDLSRRAKERQITSAIRLAVVTATDGVANSDDALKIVLDLVRLAAKAAPDFAAIIPQSVPDIPVLAGITDLKNELQAAVVGGVNAAVVENASDGHESSSPNPPKPPANPEFGGNLSDVIISPSH